MSRLKKRDEKVISNKQSIYLKDELRDEICAEAERLDRSLSWMLARSWVMSRDKFKELPAPLAEEGK